MPRVQEAYKHDYKNFRKLGTQSCGKQLPGPKRAALASSWRGKSSITLRSYNGAMPFALRDARPEDFEALWRIDQQCFPPGIAYSQQELQLYMARRGAFTLIANQPREPNGKNRQNEDGKIQEIAGFLVAHGGATGHIITIDVVHSFRRAGVGSQLLRAAEDRLRENGSRAVGLETAVDNLPALSFYKRLGYQVIKTWPRYYSTGVDALVLKKQLGLASCAG